MRRPSLRRGVGEAGGGVAAEIVVGGAYVPSTSHVKVVEQILAVARRAVVRTTRQRGLLIFPMIFPLILFAINGSALEPGDAHSGLPDPQLP